MSIKNTVNFSKVKAKMKTGITMYGKTESGRLEKSAKSNAKWTDRTSNARNSIQGDFEWKGDIARINLSGNMEYSVFLELAYGKRYAILVPTIEKSAPSIINGYKKLVK